MRILITIYLILSILWVNADAEVEVRRWGDENPVKVVAKSIFWGAVAGLALGGAIAIVADEDQEDYIKWGFVIGTFGGFGYGIYHVATRERPTTSLLNINEGGLAFNFPTVRLVPIELYEDRHLDGRVSFVSFHF
jgi:hypothetical protein